VFLQPNNPIQRENDIGKRPISGHHYIFIGTCMWKGERKRKNKFCIPLEGS